MLAMDCSMRELFNQVITVRWEWLLLVVASRYFSAGRATIIFTDQLLKSRLAPQRRDCPVTIQRDASTSKIRSHNAAISDDPLLSPKIRVRNSQPDPRDSKPETLNPEPFIRKCI